MKTLQILVTASTLIASTSVNAWWSPFDNNNNRWNNRSGSNTFGDMMNDVMGDMSGDMDVEMKFKIKGKGNSRGYGNANNYWNNYYSNYNRYTNDYTPYGYQQYDNQTPYRATPAQTASQLKQASNIK